MSAAAPASVTSSSPTGRPRVLVLTRSYPNALLPALGLWVERPTLKLAERCDVRVLSPVPYCPPLPSVGPLREYTRFRGVLREETRNGIEVLRPRFPVGPGTVLYPLEAAGYFAGVRSAVDSLRERFPFDVIHAHFIYPDGVVAERLARRYSVPFVVSEHAPWRGWFSRRGVAAKALPAARRASMLMPVSTAVRADMLEYGIDDERIEVVPPGVDETLFAPQPGAERSDDILFVGFVNFNKGLDVLFEAMRILQSRGSRARLLVAGGAHYRNTRLQGVQLARLPEELGIADRVEFFGVRPPEEIARLMASAGVVVLPSRAESFGAVLVEALACGTPVVATRCGGPEDIVTPEVGELVPREDPDALAGALERVLAERDRFDASDLRRYAVERFGLARTTALTVAVYERVLAR